MSGCVHCVWDVYREEVEEWAGKRRERERQMEGLVEARGGGGLLGGRKRGIGESSEREGAVGDLDGMGGGFEGVDLREEGLFEGVPVGIREFMAMEKRLRERRGDQG